MVERVELKIDGIYQMQDSMHHRKYILYFHGKYIRKSAADRQGNDRSVRGDTAECCSVSKSVFSVTLHLASNPSRGVNTKCHGPLPCPLPVTVCWDLAPNYTASH